MKIKPIKRLKYKMLLSMLAIVTLQTSITMAVFRISDTARQLSSNSVQMFKNSVTSKSKEMEKQMISWSDISGFEKQINKLVIEMENQYQLPAKEIFSDAESRQAFLNKTPSLVLDNLRNTKTNGSFIIMDGTGEENKDSIFLRDVNPQDSSGTDKDILVLAGSSELMFQQGFTLDSIWTSRLPISKGSNFYYEPYNAGNTCTDIDSGNLGYWSAPFRLKSDDAQVITYTRPLLDSNHQSIGIIGICIFLDYLNRYLDINEMSIDNTSSYYMGIAKDSASYETVLVNKNYYKSRLSPNSRLTIKKKKDVHRLYPVNAGNNDNGSLFFSDPIRLYNTNTPFVKQQWVLGGIVQESTLYQSTHQFDLALWVSSVLAFTISILGGIVITSSMVKPLRDLTKNINFMKPYDVNIKKTNISEVDELVEKIESLSQKVYKAGSRVADILEISNLSLGICEEERGSSSIFCTRKFLELTGLALETWTNNYADIEEYTPKIQEFKKQLVKDKEEEDVFLFMKKQAPKQWFRIKRIPSHNGELVLILDITHDMEEKLKIKHDRDYDVLTDLFNRRAFYRMAGDVLSSPENIKGVMSIWDLDNLKYINDTYGHDMGDKYICSLAQVIKNHTNENMIAARMSGDEFMIYIYGDDDTEHMYQYLEKIHADFTSRRLPLPDGTLLPVSVSAGMASIYETKDLEQLTRYADFAMYEAKRNTKGAIMSFDKNRHMKNYLLMQGVGELNRILSEEQIRYAFQPIVDIRKHEVFGYEALMRPISELLGSPQDFLQVAQEQSKLNQVETITWFHALRDYKNLEGRKKNARIFVNSIPNQVLSDKNLRLLEQEFGDILSHVVLEVTEGEKMNASHEQIKRNFCKRWNIMWALDDYGSGYSNTDMLVSNEFDFVKLDMSLVRNIQDFPERRSLVQGMIAYCHSKNIKVIAEGVESKAELKEMMKAGADYVQGFYFARPGFVAEEILEEKYLV